MNRLLDNLPILALILFITSFWLLLVGSIPRLTGYGCEGASGPLYANEEDHFPKCDAIVPTDMIRESLKDYKDTV